MAGIPTARFRTRLAGMAARRGIAVIGVDPAYTSKWGDQHWRKPLQQQTSEPVTGHHGAAAAIGRRGLGLAIRRRPAGPRNGQRTAVRTPPARPDHQPSTTPDGAAVPAHRHAHHEACRSTGKHPPPAANTVRAAQDSLLLTNQERSALGIGRARPRLTLSQRQFVQRVIADAVAGEAPTGPPAVADMAGLRICRTGRARIE